MRYQKLSIEKFDEMINDWDQSLVDVKAPLNKALYDAVNRSIAVPDSTLFDEAMIEGRMTDRGFITLCGRLDVPHGWLRSGKCPIDLDQTIIDRMKQDADGDSLVRFRETHGKTIMRAALSDRYMTYNHKHLWDVVKHGIETSRLKDMTPVVWKPTIDDWMQAWILFDGVIADPDNEIRTYDGGGAGGLKPAVHIRNSEDGTGRVGIRSGLYRSYCDNGVILGLQSQSDTSAIHVGNNYHMVDAKLAVAMGEAVRLTGQGLEEYLKAATQHIAVGLDQIVDEWSTKFKMADETATMWKGFISRSETWGDVVMATADFAGTLENPQLQTEFEELSGTLLFAPRQRYVEVS